VAPILRVERLTKYFSGLAALKDVSFETEEGQICGLIGPNGAGKTTLFSIIACALRPTSGTVLFKGRDFTGSKSFHAVKAGIVRTHQIARPFRSMTVLENVEVAGCFGQRRSSGNVRKQAMKVLEWAGLDHLSSASAGTLSVGDLKRLELARTLATQPSLLLCDEVCSGLTESETRAVLDLLRRMRELGTTIIYVEHNLKAIMAVCERVIVLNFGRKLAEGTPEAMQNDPSVIEAYIGKPASV